MKALSISWNQSFFLSQLSFTNSSQETINNLPTALWQDFFFSSIFFSGRKKNCKKMCCLDSSWSHSTMNWVLFSHGPIFVLSTKSQKQQQNSATHWATCTPKCGGGWCFRSCAQRFWLYVAQWSKIANFLSKVTEN